MIYNPVKAKAEFIQILRDFVKNDGRGTPDGYGRDNFMMSRGVATLATAFADWLEEQHWIVDDKYGRVSDFIGDFLVEAHEDFVKSPRWAELRKRYTQETTYELPDLRDPRGSYGWAFVTRDWARLIPLLLRESNEVGSWLEHDLVARFRARQALVEEAWHDFQRYCLRPMAKQLQDDRFRGRSGRFDGVTIMSYALTGRIMFTLKAGGDEISFVHDESDLTGLRSGANFTATDPLVAAEMIRRVVGAWDFNKFKQDDKIGLG